MNHLQDVYNRLNETKKESKKLRDTWRDMLANSKSYQNVVEELKSVRAKKQQIENALRQDFQREIAKLENLSSDMKSDNELLTDLALTSLMKGETVRIKDEYENEYEPVFNVKFKKAAAGEESTK